MQSIPNADITNIYDLIHTLAQRIESLETEVRTLKKEKYASIGGGINETPPEYSFHEWLDVQFTVTEDQINALFDQPGGILNAFKQTVSDNWSRIDQPPVFKRRNRLFIWIDEPDTNHDEKRKTAIPWSEKNLSYFIQEIWRKFLQTYLSMNREKVDQDIRDIQYKAILGMRIELYEKDKNRRDIQKWLHSMAS